MKTIKKFANHFNYEFKELTDNIILLNIKEFSFVIKKIDNYYTCMEISNDVFSRTLISGNQNSLLEELSHEINNKTVINITEETYKLLEVL